MVLYLTTCTVSQIVFEYQAGVHSTQGLASRTGSSRSVHLKDVGQSSASMELSLLDEQVSC